MRVCGRGRGDGEVRAERLGEFSGEGVVVLFRELGVRVVAGRFGGLVVVLAVSGEC